VPRSQLVSMDPALRDRGDGEMAPRPNSRDPTGEEAPGLKLLVMTMRAQCVTAVKAAGGRRSEATVRELANGGAPVEHRW
jgi:hypothetical protein